MTSFFFFFRFLEDSRQGVQSRRVLVSLPLGPFKFTSTAFPVVHDSVFHRESLIVTRKMVPMDQNERTQCIQQFLISPTINPILPAHKQYESSGVSLQSHEPPPPPLSHKPQPSKNLPHPRTQQQPLSILVRPILRPAKHPPSLLCLLHLPPLVPRRQTRTHRRAGAADAAFTTLPAPGEAGAQIPDGAGGGKKERGRRRGWDVEDVFAGPCAAAVVTAHFFLGFGVCGLTGFQRREPKKEEDI